ncbi:MAG: restriction endonuclease subunit S [Methyloprofundus sp.]|nr:restriction endonuclease subunit S [Methyloprofundus sp.]
MNKLVPELRFKEFSGEWEEKELIDICKMQAGKFVQASEIYNNFSESLNPCFGGNGLRGYTKSYTHIGNYPLIGRQGELCGNIKFAIGQFHATEHAVVSEPIGKTNRLYLYYLLITLKLNQYATGQAQPGLSVKVLEKVKASAPSDEKEQQKIATCLTSLDSLIAATYKKEAALKQHKKGLMQQLFISGEAQCD